MIRSCIVAILLLAGGAGGAAANGGRCLSHQERLTAVAAQRLVPLAKVLRRVKARLGGDVVRVRLCDFSGRMVYRLTVLPRNGKVVLALVYADNGADVGGS